MQTQYLCPICQTPLKFNGASYTCSNSHSFDRAKEGYVNLLPVQFKRSKQPGDNKAMVNARRNFLALGHYQPLVDAIKQLYGKHKVPHASLLDAGCGEGYYTHQFGDDDFTVYGVDIAKEAVKKAAKSYPKCHFSVATLSHLPFADDFFDVIISIYAPILELEFTRVLKTQGLLVTVTPGKDHLLALKEKIYWQANQHDDQKLAIENLSLIEQLQVKYTMTITKGEQVLDLLSMTPFAFKASDEVKQQLATLEDFQCQADFILRLYRK